MRYFAIWVLKVFTPPTEFDKQLVIFTSQAFGDYKIHFVKYCKQLPLPPLLFRN